MDIADDKSEKQAWDFYLEVTRDLHGRRYERIEPHAWAQLQARRGLLRPAKPKRKAAA